MKEFLNISIVILLIISLSGCMSGSTKKQDPRPNILFIMSDDHAYQAISCYGDSLNETPNIDRLANSGVRFNNSYVTNSICAPSRAVMLTGTYSHINGHVDNYSTFDGSQITFPKLLQEAGYQTAMVGKWHLKSEPTGFDYYNILPGQGNYYNPDFIENGIKKRIPGYVTDITTDKAFQWLNKRNKDKPFCMLLHHKAPHRNWMPGPEYLNKYDSVEFNIPENFFDDYNGKGSAARTQEMEIAKHMMMAYDLKVPEYYAESNSGQDLNLWNSILNRMDSVQNTMWKNAYNDKNKMFLESDLSGDDLAKWKYQRYMQDYLACIASVDDNIGRVLDYLEENGLRENTIVVYTSDQGFYLGEHGWFDKRFMYEQSLRMPLIISYPESIKPKVDNQNMVVNIDFAPTFLEYAGVEIPERMQGVSLKGVLEGDGVEKLRDAVYYRYYEYPAVHSVKRHYGIRTKKYKLIHFYYDDDYWELYDMESDPMEMNNIYSDLENTSVVNDLKSELYDLQAKYSDTETDRFLPTKGSTVAHKAIGGTISLVYPFSTKYMASGDNALIDGVITSDGANYSYGLNSWQGFEGVNLEVIIDLPEPSNINKITASFLHKPSSWIFRPDEVNVYLSDNGTEYRLLDTKQSLIPVTYRKSKREYVEFEFEGEEVRYIKLIAKNIGTCPEWHIGGGKKAWLFADEIIID